MNFKIRFKFQNHDFKIGEIKNRKFGLTNGKNRVLFLLPFLNFGTEVVVLQQFVFFESQIRDSEIYFMILKSMYFKMYFAILMLYLKTNVFVVSENEIC